jgi:hypothetical protein
MQKVKKPNEEYKKLIENHYFLNEELSNRNWKSRLMKFTTKTKHSSIWTFSIISKRLIIDEQSEELKKRIDDIGLAMIDKTERSTKKCN